MSEKNDPGIADILHRIVEGRRRHVDGSKRSSPLWEIIARINEADQPRGFRASLSIGTGVNIIAELKKASPSMGVIRKDFSPVVLARSFEANGAAAVSVLTEPDFFLGDPSFLGEVRRSVRLPLLRKDFIIDPYQVYESRALGADAVLLIVKVVGRRLLAELIQTARAVGIDALVEVNNEIEVETALVSGADLIGINNRDLKTFAVDRQTTMRLIPLIPGDIPVVAMSGIRSRIEMNEYIKTGIRSFLIGQALMEIDDIEQMGSHLRSLTEQAIHETH